MLEVYFVLFKVVSRGFKGFLFFVFAFFCMCAFVVVFLKKFEVDIYINAKMIIKSCYPFKHMFGYTITFVFIGFFFFFFFFFYLRVSLLLVLQLKACRKMWQK